MHLLPVAGARTPGSLLLLVGWVGLATDASRSVFATCVSKEGCLAVGAPCSDLRVLSGPQKWQGWVPGGQRVAKRRFAEGGQLHIAQFSGVSGL